MAAATFTALASVASAPAATAHPLGNFSVNHHTGLVLRPDRIDAHVVVDHAEISALQERPAIDTDHDGRVGDSESRAHAGKACSDLSGRLHLTVGRTRADWKRTSATLVYENGEAGLRTNRLTCSLTTPADLTEPADIRAGTNYDTTRVGWHEMAATGQGVRITQADVPATSATRELRQYPQYPLASPLDQRTAELRGEPGQSTRALPAVAADLPGADVVGGVIARVTGAFDALVGAREITLPVGLLALLLALVLGASHAAMPGHGKTIMAAYLAGRRGTRRDAFTVGATVTLTHTAGVLILGLPSRPPPIWQARPSCCGSTPPVASSSRASASGSSWARSGAGRTTTTITTARITATATEATATITTALTTTGRPHQPPGPVPHRPGNSGPTPRSRCRPRRTTTITTITPTRRARRRPPRSPGVRAGPASSAWASRAASSPAPPPSSCSSAP